MLTLSPAQIKYIYEAGIKRGSDEATAFDWGCNASGNHYDGLIEAVHSILNTDVTWEDRVLWSEVEGMLEL